MAPGPADGAIDTAGSFENKRLYLFKTFKETHLIKIFLIKGVRV